MASDFTIQFNVLWLNPHNPDTFPEGLIDALEDPLVLTTIRHSRADNASIEGRLRAKMQVDALRPIQASLEEDEPAPDKAMLSKTAYSEEEIEEATHFLRLSVRYSICAFLGLCTELFHSTRSTVFASAMCCVRWLVDRYF